MKKSNKLLRTLIVLVVMSVTAVMTANAQSKVTKALKADEIDWGNVQHPHLGTIDNGEDFTVYGQVYKAGVTEPAGEGAGITAELGYSTTNTDPATWTNWISATYNVDAGNNDEYMANLGAEVGVGTYYYAYRYKYNSGAFYYAGTGGAWNDDNGVLTVNPSKPFITKWKTNNPSSTIGTLTPSTNKQIYFPGIGTNYTIEWEEVGNPANNGTKTVASSDSDNPVLIDDFPSPGEYIVKVYPQGFESIQFGSFSSAYGDQEKLTEIQQWGDVQWTSMFMAFNGCVNMQLSATDAPDLSNVTDMRGMFRKCKVFNGDIGGWDVSKVTDMSYMFYGCDTFNQPLNNWDVSSVTDMYMMFNSCSAFNQPLNNWDVSSVTKMGYMFYSCDAFNGDISDWNVSSVTDMNYMFHVCDAFNQPLNSWNVSSVTDMNGMFYGCDTFNQDLSSWNVSNVTDMNNMFSGCFAFNQDLSSWNVSNVTDMSSMFNGCSAFNQDLGSWNLKSIVHDESNWKHSLKQMFDYSGMDCANYSNTLIGWANNSDTPDNLTFGVNGLTYGTNGQTARNILIGKGWTITGDSYDASCALPTELFITKWNTNKPSSTIGSLPQSSNTQIYFPGIGTNYTIEWEEVGNPANNGTKTVASSDNDNPVLIDFGSAGEYLVKVSPQGFERTQFGNWSKAYGDKEKLTEIQQWGNVAWTSMDYAFIGCKNMQLSATDVPDLSNVTSMKSLFGKCKIFNGDISSWDVSNVTHMNSMFSGCSAFNQDISGWDVSNVTEMVQMFGNCSAFNQDISGWDVSSVIRMHQMFRGCAIFNQPLDGWGTKVSNVTDMSYMFSDCPAFNQPLNNWDVSSVTTMSRMFKGCSAFNQPLNNWNVSSVTRMGYMFYGCSAFNQPLDSWGTKISNVTDMYSMFSDCSSFNQDLGNWNLSSITGIGDMLDNSGLDCANYGNTLIGWANNPATPDYLTLGADGLTYGTNGQTARNTLIGKNWTINGDSYDAGCTETTGIETVANNGSTLSIYPNPAQDWVTVEVSDNEVGHQLTIVDVSGKVVYSQPITATTITVTVNRLQQGIYFVKTDNVTSKLVVK